MSPLLYLFLAMVRRRMVVTITRYAAAILLLNRVDLISRCRDIVLDVFCVNSGVEDDNLCLCSTVVVYEPRSLGVFK